jgi:hypothetical protein
VTQSKPVAPRCKGWTHAGSRIGQRCPRPAKEGCDYCSRHLAGHRAQETRARREAAEYQAREEAQIRRFNRAKEIAATKDVIVNGLRDYREWLRGDTERGLSRAVGGISTTWDAIWEAMDRLRVLESEESGDQLKIVTMTCTAGRLVYRPS